MSINSNLGLCGRRRLRAHRLSLAEGIEIRPDMLHGLFVESLDRRVPALRGIDFQLYLTTVRIHGIRRIQVHPFEGGIFHFYYPVSDRHRHGNPARMDGLHFLVSTKQLHRLEICFELEFCSRVWVVRAAERRSEPFFSLRHYVYSEYRWVRASFFFPLLWRIGIARALGCALLLFITPLMLALGLQPSFLLLPVIQGRCGKSDIEVSRGEIVRARIVFFGTQRFLESINRIRRQRLDRKQRPWRRRARGFRTILFEERKRLLNTHDPGHAGPVLSARAEGRQPDDLARCVEQRTA